MIILFFVLLGSVSSAKTVDNVSDTMIAYTFFMQEDPMFVDILSYPVSSNITKEDLMLIKQFNQMYPKRIETNVKYRQVADTCQKVSHHTYQIKSHKKGWLTNIEDFLRVTTKNHDTAQVLGKDAGRLFIICLENTKSKTCDADVKKFKFEGCKAIEIKMNDDYLVAKFKVNDSMELKRIDVQPSNNSSSGAKVISK